MGNNREVLKRLGAASQDETALIEAGKQKVAATLKDVIAKALRDSGLTEATGFEVNLENGESFTILSPQNPRMATPASEVRSVTPRQSARAGRRDVVRDWSALLA